MAYSLDHWNPYEQMTKANFLRYLDYIDRTVSEYERNSVFAKHLVPERIHSKIMGLAGAIQQSKDFYAYYQDAKELYQIVDILNNQDVFTDSAKANPLWLKPTFEIERESVASLVTLPLNRLAVMVSAFEQEIMKQVTDSGIIIFIICCVEEY